jgi:hypothetical protein
MIDDGEFNDLIDGFKACGFAIEYTGFSSNQRFALLMALSLVASEDGIMC